MLLNDDVYKDEYEFHIYLYNPFEDKGMKMAAICIDMDTTSKCLERGDHYIYTTQTYFLSTTILKRGYRLFLHKSPGKCIECKIGFNTWTDKEIKYAHNLRNLLLGNY